MPDQNPFDMTGAMKAMIQTELQTMAPLLGAQAALIAGNALRAQAFGMTAAINPAEFIVQPAKLTDGGCLVLLRGLKFVPNTYRFIAGPAYNEDKSVAGRAIVIFHENEADLPQTQFINLSDEAKSEINRQLDAINLDKDGTIELCLVVVSEEIPGYEYAKSAVTEDMGQDPAQDTIKTAAPLDNVEDKIPAEEN